MHLPGQSIVHASRSILSTAPYLAINSTEKDKMCAFFISYCSIACARQQCAARDSSSEWPHPPPVENCSDAVRAASLKMMQLKEWAAQAHMGQRRGFHSWP